MLIYARFTITIQLGADTRAGRGVRHMPQIDWNGINFFYYL